MTDKNVANDKMRIIKNGGRTSIGFGRVMKKTLMILLVAVLAHTNFGQTPEFCERVLAYRDGRSDYLIPINIKSGDFSGKVLVESYNLLDYLKATRGLSAKSYGAFVLNLLKEKRELEMSNVKVDDRGFFLSGRNLKEGTFRIVRSSPSFDVVFAKGCELLIRYYFSPSLPDPIDKSGSSCKDAIKLNARNLFIRPKFDFDEQSNVIERLFEMDIPIYRDDISGSFEIAYSALR